MYYKELDCEFGYCYTNIKWLYSNRGHSCGCQRLKKCVGGTQGPWEIWH